MDNTPTRSTERLDEIFAENLAAEETGEAPPLEDLLAAHPDLADDVQSSVPEHASETVPVE